MRYLPISVIVLVFNFCVTLCEIPKDEYHEELFIKPLPHTYIYSYFQFTTLWDTPFHGRTFDHCHLFPHPLGELIARYDVKELHVSLTKGLWRHETWGYPVQEAPPGAEVWAWFKQGTSNIDNKWKELTGALSGLLCASLNFIDSYNSMSPQLSLRPFGIDNVKTPTNSSHLRYSTLPREIVCTENLTPWKKMLPCDSRRGLSALLNSDHIYNTVYHSLGLHFRPICMNKDCSVTGLELKQTVSLVYDLIITGRAETHWSIQRLFGSGIGSVCPLAVTSLIYIDVTSNQTGNIFQLNPKPLDTVISTRGGHSSTIAVYDMNQMGDGKLYNIEATYSKNRVYGINAPPVLFTSRYITGYGQEFGGIMTKIHNRHWQPIKILFLENIPWFVPVYLHTLKIVSNGREIKPLLKKYIPGKERVRPYYLELMIELPARSLTSVSLQFEYAFLKWQEYPPDANHGFYMGAAVITAMLPVARNYTSLPQDGSLILSSINATRESYYIRVTTEVLIISLPTPDFSMPYNVICLACTVVALAFGPLHNITTKR
ncbi:hypothetical protein AAG570_001035 [Ranatra chinensis]|uniref:GPI transamidase component PIG-T n=1 Tax=Ranatra chinensis TaxID=642074 RepID=A0ABD0YAN9_9HEMI